MRPIYKYKAFVVSIIASLTIYILLIQNSLIDINVQLEKLEFYDRVVDTKNQESNRTITILNQKPKVKRDKEDVLDDFVLLKMDEEVVKNIVEPIEPVDPKNIIVEEEIDTKEIELQIEESLNSIDEDDDIPNEEIYTKEVEPKIEECLNSTDDEGDNNLTLNKVYRTNGIVGSYYFLLLDSNGSYYYLHTNKTKYLTVKELTSPSILSILYKKQSWGEVFLSRGKYTILNGKIYTEKYYELIRIVTSKKIKYRGKTFYLCN